MGIDFHELMMADYDEVLALWKRTEGIGLSDADSRPNVEAFLLQNPGLSFVARCGTNAVAQMSPSMPRAPKASHAALGAHTTINSFKRTPEGRSATAYDGGAALAGAVLCGNDGRRGYLHHLAVAPEMRRRGIGKRLVELCFEGLSRRGIRKCHIFVKAGNEEGKRFWQRVGWTERIDLFVMSRDVRP